MTIQTVMRRGARASSKQETLEILSQQVMLLNERLAGLERPAVMPAISPPTRSAFFNPVDQRPADLGVLARRMHQYRSRRQKLLPADLLGEPLYDMLLDLYASECENRQVSVTSLCIASGVSPTTALRWITVATDRGLMLRRQDAGDKRRAYLCLSNEGRAAVVKMLTEFLRCVRI